jgi:glucosamine--fructose-6-phosphate aminotransferase (isomerizing)
MYIGRRYHLATAFEGALKMKEISYLHAEGYGAGEMKHGPIAIVDPSLTTIAIALKDRVHDKMLSNIEQIRARQGRVISLATQGDETVARLSDFTIPLPPLEECFAPPAAVVPLQLFAYMTAVSRGLDPDRPRNLAKTVTVE